MQQLAKFICISTVCVMDDESFGPEYYSHETCNVHPKCSSYPGLTRQAGFIPHGLQGADGLVYSELSNVRYSTDIRHMGRQ